ncbi:MAG: S41 family peptidase [Sedimentisphaerales bacterium]|nr:S41 family peptidase [Sedimentisphaerales bacterium]
MRTKNKYLVLLACLALFFCGLICCRLPEQPVPVEKPPQEHSNESNLDTSYIEQVSDISKQSDGLAVQDAALDSNVVKAACALISIGKFDEAGELILEARYMLSGAAAEIKTQLDQLAEIVQKYKDINESRRSAREAAYVERLAELHKIRTATETGDVNDLNDVNDITKALSAITKVNEFADEAQKAELLSELFTRETFKRAKDKANGFESKGKWLDSYAVCYSWLQAIEEANEAYSDYAEQLIEKAGVAASFQDSPCESRQERYEGVKKEMFVRSIDALRFNYVSSIINYRQMAIGAVKRCRLLGEVTSLLPAETAMLPESRINSPEKLSAWSDGLATVLDEMEQSPMEVSRDKFIDIFENVLKLNTKTINLPSEVLIAHFAEASLSTLDPYTVIVWPRQVEDFEKIMTNEFTGIGIEISKEKGLLTIVSLLPDTPAYNSGLDAEDVIEKVDGVDTKDMSLACAVKNITGKAGTEVTLTIRRAGEDQTREITISRARITVPTIRGWQRTGTGKWLYMIDEAEKIGYVRVTSFSEKTVSDLEEVLSELEAEGLKGLIIDLRFNSGGLLNMAIEVADAFIEEGPIVITRPRSWVSSTYAWARKEGTHPNYPLVVLINSFSASASEIVAGALADPLHKRAILIGERTHGKGSVQGIISYPRGGAQLKYTMAYYHLPSGQRVKSKDEAKKEGKEDWGVGPDIEVKLRSDEMKKMFDLQRDNDVLVGAGHDRDAAPLKKHMADESLSADPQLAIGVLIIKNKLIETGSEI